LITLTSPRGSSVYLVAFLINFFSFPPIPCTYFANAVIPLFGLAVTNILGYDAVRIAKGVLCQIERDAMLE